MLIGRELFRRRLMSDLFVPLDDHPGLPADRQPHRTAHRRAIVAHRRCAALRDRSGASVRRQSLDDPRGHSRTRGARTCWDAERGEKRLRVTRPEPRRVSSGVSRALALHDVTFMELWEAMMAIEPAAAQYAAARRTPAQLQGLTRASARFKRERHRHRRRRGRGRGFLHRGRGGQRQPGAGALASPAQSATRSHAHALIDRVPQARARIQAAQGKIIEPSSCRRANKHALDGKAHPRLQARLRS